MKIHHLLLCRCLHRYLSRSFTLALSIKRELFEGTDSQRTVLSLLQKKPTHDG